jgi:hypothetical protein
VQRCVRPLRPTQRPLRQTSRQWWRTFAPQADAVRRGTTERQFRLGAVVDEVSGAVFEQEITADLPAGMQFLSPRLFMNSGAIAAAVAYDSSGVYVETDF